MLFANCQVTGAELMSRVSYTCRQVRDLGFPARQALDASDIGIDQSRDDHHWHAFNFTGKAMQCRVVLCFMTGHAMPTSAPHPPHSTLVYVSTRPIHTQPQQLLYIKWCCAPWSTVHPPGSAHTGCDTPHHLAAWVAAGVRCIFDSSKHAITLLSFAKLRSDLLAFGNAKGELWLAQPGDEAKAHKVSTQAGRQQSCLYESTAGTTTAAAANPLQKLHHQPMPWPALPGSAPATSGTYCYGCANLIR